MERSPAWVAVLKVVLPLAALSLCSWAMDAARNRGRELPGGKEPPPVTPGATAAP
jgi:hypothetical protein